MLCERHRRLGVFGGRLVDRGPAQLQVRPQLHLGRGRSLSDQRGQNPRGRGPVQRRRQVRVQPERTPESTGADAGHQLAAVQRRKQHDRYAEDVQFSLDRHKLYM